MVAPGDSRYKYDFEISRGGVSVGLILVDGRGNHNPGNYSRDPMPTTALKTYSGEQKHDDSEPPFSPISQSDWAGGRGQLEFELDSSRYYDAWRVGSMRNNELIAGGMDVYTRGYRDANNHWPYRDGTGGVTWSWKSLYSPAGHQYQAVKFVASSSYDAKFIYLILRRVGTPNSLTIYLRNDNAGAPGTTIQSLLLAPASLEEFSGQVYRATITPSSLTSSTTYWITLEANAGDDSSNYWQVLTRLVEVANNGYYSDNGTSWTQYEYNLIYRVTDAGANFKAYYFELKGALFAALSYLDGSAPKIYRNGYQGLATAGGSNTLSDSAATWTTGEHEGAICVLTAGTGSDVDEPYRTITGNTGTQLTVSPAWDITPDTTTEYSIVGSERWIEITGHGITVPITAVKVINQIVYFALGDAIDMRRLRAFVSTGAWHYEWVTETGNKAGYLEAVQEGAGITMWAGTRGIPAQVKKATVPDGSGTGTIANLTFAAAIQVGDIGERITGLVGYGQNQNLWVLKEGSIYEMQSGVPVRLQIDEMSNVRDPRNGKAFLTHNVYLYFSLLEGGERYFNNQLDNLGPDLGAGFPEERRGPIAAMTGYPGRYIWAVDAGEQGYSSVVVHNDTGWHELYRAPVAGQRIRNIYIQSVPGPAVNRLWISVGSDLVWVPIDNNPYTAPQPDYNFYPFAWESHVISSWYYLGRQEIEKFYQSLKLATENLITGSTWIEAEYQIDKDTTWRSCGAFDTSFTQEIDFNDNNLVGKRIRVRLRLITMDSNITPRVVAQVIDAVSWDIHKFIDTLTFRAFDRDKDLIEQPDPLSAQAKLAQLDAWASRPLPVLINSWSPIFNGKYGFIQPASVKILKTIRDEQRSGYICSLRIIEK